MNILDEFKYDLAIDARKPSNEEKSRVADELPPMFNLRRIDTFTLAAAARGKKVQRTISKVACSNNVLILGTTDCTVYRWSLEGKSPPEEISISKRAEDRISDLFLDPSGNHLLICLTSNITYYLHSRTNQLKKVLKTGDTITSVCFNRKLVSENSTKGFLAGTSTGKIYECLVDHTAKEKSATLLFQLDSALPISSIFFETFDSQVFIMCVTSTPTRLYYFYGGPTFAQVFSNYTVDGITFSELPGTIAHAELHCSSAGSTPTFAIMTQEGIYHGTMLVTNTASSSENVIIEATMMPYHTATSIQYSKRQQAPISLAMSEYHFLILYSTKLVVQSKLTGAVVYEELLSFTPTAAEELPVALRRDVMRNALWLMTTSSIYQISILSEDRDVWNLYIKKALQTDDSRYFDMAYQHCKTQTQRDQIHMTQAHYYLRHCNMEQAAKHFASSSLSFDSAILKLIDNSLETADESSRALIPFDITSARNVSALIAYLQTKLQIIPVSQKSQRTMLATWLCELMLYDMTTSDDDKGVKEQQFEDFLRKHKAMLDHHITSNLILSYGFDCKHLLLMFSKIIGDYDIVINIYISQEQYSNVIDILKNANFLKTEKLIYLKSPILIVHHPEEVVELFIMKPELNVVSLLPALAHYCDTLDKAQGTEHEERLSVSCEGQKMNFAIYYLRHAVTQLKVRDAVVFHTYILLLFKYKEQASIIEFFEPLLESALTPNFDCYLCYRFSCQYGNTTASIYLLLLLQEYEEALRLALTHDLDFAYRIASLPQIENNKTLWRLIASYYIDNASLSSQDIIRNVMECIQRSNGALEIQDVLSSLPDFSEIDMFKKDICGTLEAYSSRIASLRNEIEELGESAGCIEKELEHINTRGITLQNNQKCELCHENIFQRQFYLFPCSHTFHYTCLLQAIPQYVDNNTQLRMRELLDQIQTLSLRSKDSDKRILMQLEYAQNELDSIIAGECLYCGECCVKSLAMSLLCSCTREEIDSWKL